MRGFRVYRLNSTSYLHREHNNESFKMGQAIYKWGTNWTDTQSIMFYFVKLGFDKNKWVYTEELCPDNTWQNRWLPIPKLDSQQLLQELFFDYE